MALTYKLISYTTLTTSATSIEFSSIPNTYTDLVLRVSARDTSASTGRWIRLRFNSTTTNYAETYLAGTGSAASSGKTSSNNAFGASGWIASTGSTNTANTFSNIEVYIPSYNVSQNKPMSAVGMEENNTTAANMGLVAGLWVNTAAITSISILPNTEFALGSSFFLYGVANS